ncbi:hypothetical protein C8Q75DRAFT_804793 [Abortiporus biennis]|nr:hypothetical protein C8Q75DRAFT_804793 [Abortiporus biennis]
MPITAMLDLNHESPTTRLGYSISQVIPFLKSLHLQFDQLIIRNWRSRFKMVVKDFMDLLNHIPAPRLESLKIVPKSVSGRAWRDTFPSDITSIFGGRTPRLHTLHISNVSISWASSLFCNTLCTLTIIDIPDPLKTLSTRDLFFSTIGKLQSLESIHLKFDANPEWSWPRKYYFDSWMQDDQKVSLPNLRYFNGDGGLGTIGFILGSISMPSINELILFGRLEFTNQSDEASLVVGEEFTCVFSQMSHKFRGFSRPNYNPRSIVLNYNALGTGATLVIRNRTRRTLVPESGEISGGFWVQCILRVSIPPEMAKKHTALERLLSILPNHVPVRRTHTLLIDCPDSTVPSYNNLKHWKNITSLTICGPQCATALLPLLYQSSSSSSTPVYEDGLPFYTYPEHDVGSTQGRVLPLPKLNFLRIVMPLEDDESPEKQKVYTTLSASLQAFIPHRKQTLKNISIGGTRRFTGRSLKKVQHVGENENVKVIRLTWKDDLVERKQLGLSY